MAPDPRDDPFRRVDYRRMVAWPERIRREAPFILSVFAAAPEASVLDLGCGTGEHADFLAGRGFRAVGIDRSEAQIGKARDYEGRHGEAGPEFLLGDMKLLDRHTGERFGAALWLGNGVPYLEDDELAILLEQLSRRLLPGGLLLFQLLNYERIRRHGVRHLPLNFRDHPDGAGEVVFLRLMTVDGADHVRFNPMSLALCPGAEPPVELKSASEVRVRTWRREELQTALAAAGFRVTGTYGDMVGGPFDPDESADLVMVAELEPAAA